MRGQEVILLNFPISHFFKSFAHSALLTEGGGGVQEPLILVDEICEQPLILIIARLQYSHCTKTIPHIESPFLCYCLLGDVNPYSNWSPNTIQCPFTHQPEGLATPI